MGCLEQGNPLISRLGGEGVSLRSWRVWVWGWARWGGRIGIRGHVPGVAGVRLLASDHLRPDGAHLLGCLLQ